MILASTLVIQIRIGETVAFLTLWVRVLRIGIVVLARIVCLWGLGIFVGHAQKIQTVQKSGDLFRLLVVLKRSQAKRSAFARQLAHEEATRSCPLIPPLFSPRCRCGEGGEKNGELRRELCAQKVYQTI